MRSMSPALPRGPPMLRRWVPARLRRLESARFCKVAAGDPSGTDVLALPASWVSTGWSWACLTISPGSSLVWGGFHHRQQLDAEASLGSSSPVTQCFLTHAPGRLLWNFKLVGIYWRHLSTFSNFMDKINAVKCPEDACELSPGYLACRGQSQPLSRPCVGPLPVESGTTGPHPVT